MIMDPLDPHRVVSHGWFLSAPNAVLGVQLAFAAAALFLLVQVIRWYLQASPINPFLSDCREHRRPYVADTKKRDEVIKQSFRADKVPEDLDAIVVGSGIGGLTTAAILAKAGRRVLVLERHDQAGGCCHTFVDKGFEFDVGIHYVGEVAHGIGKFLLDQVSSGQVEFAQMEDSFDIISIGYGENSQRFPVATGFEKWKAELERQFPGERLAIGKYFELLKKTKNCAKYLVLLKVMPLWLSRLFIQSRLIHLVTNLWTGDFRKSTQEIIVGLTKDKHLQSVLSYIWMAYGTPPSQSHFLMHSLIKNHYSKGAFYPVGGASEIAYNVVPVIERAGGRVLVNANVEEILHNGKKVMGVIVGKGNVRCRIEAPIVISDAGVVNTFQTLLPEKISKESYFFELSSQLKSGTAIMTVFLGLDASNEDLNLPRHHIWAFATNEVGSDCERHLEMEGEEMLSSEVPGFYISFPSAKDPNWNSHPQRRSKSTCVVLAACNWDWFEKFQNTTLKKRGDKYEEIKNVLGHRLIDHACKFFPQITHHIAYVEVGSPLTNKHYLGQARGEAYGLDHNIRRFDPLVVAKLRSQTDIQGLYLTGQDVLTSGFAGALYSGLLSAGAILGRNLYGDLIRLYKTSKKAAQEKKKD